MGSTNSTLKTAPAMDLNEKPVPYVAPLKGDEGVSEMLRRLALSGEKKDEGEISSSDLEAWRGAFESDPKNKLASTVLSQGDLLTTLTSREAKIKDVDVFNIKLEYEGLPVTNQKSSGRCWLFATTNVLRLEVSKKLNLGEFQLSQSYLFFYDALSKADYFLENTIDLVDEPLESRVVQFLFEAPENDGGQWDMAVNLVERFGVVPQDVYPESFHSSNSGKLKGFLTTKLREYALELRALKADVTAIIQREHYHLSGEDCSRLLANALRSKKKAQLADVYRVLAITLGTPPKPEDSFTWEYYDKDGKYGKVDASPLSFYHDLAGGKASRALSLINDPRNKYDTLYTVSRLGNVWGARPVYYVNSDISILKKVAIKLLSKDIPVWFGCDVGKFSSSPEGILDVNVAAYDSAFSTSSHLTKAQRLSTGDSLMTHAMTLTGVHVVDGKPVRWRVQNSWGPDANKKGYFVMTDAWFDEFVYQIVADRAYVPADLVAIFDSKDPVVLEPWDPMGALA